MEADLVSQLALLCLHHKGHLYCAAQEGVGVGRGRGEVALSPLGLALPCFPGEGRGQLS